MAPRLVQEHTFDVTEYLVMLNETRRFRLDLQPLTGTYVVHGHCHQKSLGIGSCPAALLRLIPGITVHEVDQLAQHAGEVVACGISCRSQIEMGTGRRVLHPVEILARALRP